MRKIIFLLCFGVVISFGLAQQAEGQVEDQDAVPGVENAGFGFKGYFNVTDIGLLIGSTENAHPAPFSFITFNGVHLTEQFSTSLGIGVEFPSGSYMPLVLDFRYYIRNTSFSPFIQLYGGYALPLDDNINQGVWYDATSSVMSYYPKYEPYTAKGGWLLNPGFGVRSLLGENFGVVFSVAYRVQRLFYEAGEDRKRTVDSNRLVMKIGITFR